MKTEQLRESILRFRSSFWDKIETGRPPVGVADPSVWLPIQYLRCAPAQAEIQPEHVAPEFVKNDYDHVFAPRTFLGDDPMSPPEGEIALQRHGDPIDLKNIFRQGMDTGIEEQGRLVIRVRWLSDR